MANHDSCGLFFNRNFILGRESEMNASYSRKSNSNQSGVLLLIVSLALIAASAVPAHAQALGWEGETGVFVTPLAYTASGENQKIHAVAAYHFLDGGPVIGDFHEVSIEVGIGKRVELGYTHEFHSFGDDVNPSTTSGLSQLWQNGFEIFNGKVQVLPENYGKTKWVPAISTGFVARANVRNVGNFVVESNPSGMTGKSNGDIFVVASKIIPVKPVAFVLNAGVRGTNAELWGMGGNAPDWQARAFGAVALAFTGPDKSSIIFATEAAQQPHHPYYFDGSTAAPALNIPTTLTYAVRFVPSPKHKLNFDFGIAQIAGHVYSNGTTLIDLKARHQAAAQVSYGF
jgi:hypothetical protein